MRTQHHYLQIVLLALTGCSEVQPPAMTSIGHSCTTVNDCKEGICLDEIHFGYPGGVCASRCSETSSCTDGSTCMETNSGDSVCISSCKPTASTCRDGYICMDSGDGVTGICTSYCTSDVQCSAPARCNLVSGLCLPAENCNKTGDEDLNGTSDCEDSACAGTGTCPMSVDSACANATELSDTVASDTTGSHALFSATCTGYGGAPERVFRYKAPSSGTATFNLLAEVDLGIYLRSSCAEKTTEMECRDEQGFSGALNLIHFRTKSRSTRNWVRLPLAAR